MRFILRFWIRVWSFLFYKIYCFLSLFTSTPPQKNAYLLRNFRPVSLERKLDTSLTILGKLPDDLNGEFVRNGPNPKFFPKGAYHWFDGDGMLHGVKLTKGTASYCNRWVQTSRLRQETEHGWPIFIKLGQLQERFALVHLILSMLKARLGVINLRSGGGTANTALEFHDRRLLALQEADHPYVIRLLEDGQLETVGQHTYQNKLKHRFTAHPKVDAETGEMIFFGYNPFPSKHEGAFCTYSVVGKNGDLLFSVPISIPEPVMMHDFAITQNYSIIMDLPLVFRKENLLKGKSVYVFDSSRNSRFGIIPRHVNNVTSELKWFQAPPCYIFHVANAWEEKNEIVLYGARLEKISLDEPLIQGTSSDDRGRLCEWRFNLKTGETSQKILLDCPLDFPKIHPSLLGRRCRYVYAATLSDSVAPIFDGVVKIDLLNGGKLVGRVAYGPNRSGGECVFVPKIHKEKKNNVHDENEDDGYLLTFVYEEDTDISQFWVLDAKTMSPDPLAIVELPQRIPYGFHGIWVNDDQIRSQREKDLL